MSSMYTKTQKEILDAAARWCGRCYVGSKATYAAMGLSKRGVGHMLGDYFYLTAVYPSQQSWEEVWVNADRVAKASRIAYV
jgi:hypothetical protein